MAKFQMTQADPNAAAYPTFDTGKDEKPIVYVLVGLPGSGKSAWAAGHPEKLPVASTDAFIENYAAEKNLPYDQALKECYDDAVADMEKQVEKYTNKPASFIWDQINLNRKLRIEMHKHLGSTHRVVYVCFRVPLSECLRRQEERARDGGRPINPPRTQKLAQTASFPEPGKEPFYKVIALTHPDWGKR